MMKKFLSKSLVLLLAFLMVFSTFATAVFAADEVALAEENTEEKQESSKLQEIEELLNSNDYSEYRLIYQGQPNGEDDVVISGKDFDPAKTTAVVYKDKYLDSAEEVVMIGDTGDVTWNFEVKKSGNYHIQITYAPIVSYDGDQDG